ncbi:MAG: helix-turn-helix domain-containing protein [Eubacterium sp.]
MRLQRLRDLREDHDLKQADIADYLHISQRTYSHYETDSRSIPLEQLIRLAVYYETSLDYLTNLTDHKKAYPRGKHMPIDE